MNVLTSQCFLEKCKNIFGDFNYTLNISAINPKDPFQKNSDIAFIDLNDLHSKGYRPVLENVTYVYAILENEIQLKETLNCDIVFDALTEEQFFEIGNLKLKKLIEKISLKTIKEPTRDLLHDLRTPLTVVLTILEILNLRKKSLKPIDLKKDIDSCKLHLKRIKMMFSNYIDYNRIYDVPEQKTKVSLTDILTKTLKEHEQRFDREKKSLLLISNPQSIIVEFDRFILHQLFFNMVEHFLWFAPKKCSECIHVKTANNFFSVTISYPSTSNLTSSERHRIYNPLSSRLKDSQNGLEYNKGFVLSYNQAMSKRFKGRFELISDKNKHHLMLKLPVSTT